MVAWTLLLSSAFLLDLFRLGVLRVLWTCTASRTALDGGMGMSSGYAGPRRHLEI